MARGWKIRLMSVVILATGLAPAYSQNYKDAKATEIAQLPPFCYGQVIEGASAPEFNIPRGCGPGMNHYCFALLELIRGKGTIGNRRERMTHLQLAREQTLYTLRGMEKYPHCPIRGHVENTLNEVHALMMGTGKK
jgi:hypothetical protein